MKRISVFILCTFLVLFAGCSAHPKNTKITKKTYTGTKTPEETKTLGDIVFSDGSATPYSADLVLTDEQITKIIGAVAYVNDDGTGLIAGITYKDDIYFAKTTPEYKVTDIINSYNYDDGAYSFTGDIDGSDNLAYIQSVDENANTDLETYYPALNYACNYGTNNGFTGIYETGWYLPAQKELYDICANLETIENIRKSAGQEKLTFIQDVSRSNPGGNDYNYIYNFLSSNFKKNSLETINAVRFKYITSTNEYTYSLSSHKITKASYSESSGGGASGYVNNYYHSYVMAVHKF